MVIGNRASAFAPVRDLGLVALFDDGDDLLAEPRAPYPHARTVLALRAAAAGAAVLFTGYARTAEVQQLIRREWLRELAVDRSTLRHTAPSITVTADTDQALERDPHARAARLPHQVFASIRSALAQGPVLVQVPRAGYLVALVCQECREPARCPFCGGPAHRSGGDAAGLLMLRLVRPTERRLELSDLWLPPVAGARESGRSGPPKNSARPSRRRAVRQSSGGHALEAVPDTPALIIATPGAEPPADGGYAGAVLLDTDVLLLRADLRAGEEALRRWLNVTALVRPGHAGGSVIAVGESSDRALQALVRLDPAGFADRELAERVEAAVPARGQADHRRGQRRRGGRVRRSAAPPEQTERLGPVDLPPRAGRRRRPATAHAEGTAAGRRRPRADRQGRDRPAQRAEERRGAPDPGRSRGDRLTGRLRSRAPRHAAPDESRRRSWSTPP